VAPVVAEDHVSDGAFLAEPNMASLPPEHRGDKLNDDEIAVVLATLIAVLFGILILVLVLRAIKVL
jgi:hypothetical protein